MTGVVSVGSNVVRVSNQSDSVTGTVSKINNELVLFRGVFLRTLGQYGKLMSDLFVANEVIGGTYFEAIKTAD